MRNWLLVLGIFFVLQACSDEVSTGPGDVRWDREVCQRCAMALSEPRFAAQIRGGPEGQHQLYKFDDIGCAVIWLDKQLWKDDTATEIWVMGDQEKWIDARAAHYQEEKITPMGYGLGAIEGDGAGAIDFAAAKKHIYAVEEQTHAHRGNGHMHGSAPQ